MTKNGEEPDSSGIRFSFAARVMLFSTLLVGFTVGLSSLLVYRSSKIELEASLGQELLAVGRSTASLIDTDLLALIYTSDDGVIAFEDEFQVLRGQLDQVRRRNDLPLHGNPIYIMRPAADFDTSGMLEFVVMPDTDESGRYFVGNLYPAEDHNRKALAGKASVSTLYTDSEGMWISASVPLFDSAGTPVGLLQVDRSVDFFYERARDRAAGILSGALVCLCLGVVLAALFARDLTRPLRAMAAAVAVVGRGELHQRLNIDRGDEIGELASGLDWMAESLERHRESERRAREATEESSRSKSELLDDLDAVNRVLEVVANSSSVAAAVQTALDSLRDALGWTYGVHRVLDSETESLVVELDSGELDSPLRREMRDLRCARGEGLAGQAWEREELVIAPDLGVLQGDDIWPRLAAVGLKLGLCLPLFVRGRLVGTLELFARAEFVSDASLSDSRKDSLNSVGRLLSGAMDRLADAEERAEAAANSFALNRVLEALSLAEGRRDITEVTQVAIATICEAFGWSYGAHWTVDSAGTRLIFSTEAGELDQTARRELRKMRPSRGEGLPGRSWAEGELVFAEDLSRLDPSDGLLAGAASRSGATSAMAFPLVVHAEVAGVLGFFGGDVQELSAARLDVLRNVGRLVSGVVERRGDALERARSGETAARVMEQIAEGDLRYRMEGEYRGEFEVLQTAINASTIRLEEMVRQIGNGSIHIARAATEVAEGSATLSAHTQRQVSSLQECIKSVEELALDVTRNSERSRRATDLAAQTKGLAEQGGEIVDRTIAAMADIGVSSLGIEAITDVMEDITKKTKLLALNASIEAARAGDQGLGFAVVSNEIGELAERSSRAAQEIRDLIDESTRRIASGTKLVNESGSSLREIVSAAATGGELISEMVVASADQAQGVEQVRRMAAELHEVSVQNAGLVSRAVVASSGMAEQAALLTQLVAFFKIAGESPDAGDTGSCAPTIS